MRLMRLIFMLIMFTACQPEEREETLEITTNPELNVFDTPVVDYDYAGLLLKAQEVDGVYVHQGDIMIPELEPATIYPSKDALSDTKATSVINNLWSSGKVYYQIDPLLTNQERVINAIKYWMSVSSLEFINATSTAGYIYFTPGSGCSSYIGRIGYKQNIILSKACSTGNTVHEIGHALGLWHEQSRVDRDEVVTIHWDNISTGREHNFMTYAAMGATGQELDNHLDIESIMMYGSYSFSSNGKPTITLKDGSTFHANRTYLSTQDIEGINKLYAPEPIYENGKYYLVSGLNVYRMWGRWYYYHSKYGWKEVKLSSSGYWYYA